MRFRGWKNTLKGLYKKSIAPNRITVVLHVKNKTKLPSQEEIDIHNATTSKHNKDIVVYEARLVEYKSNNNIHLDRILLTYFSPYSCVTEHELTDLLAKVIIESILDYTPFGYQLEFSGLDTGNETLREWEYLTERRNNKDIGKNFIKDPRNREFIEVIIKNTRQSK